MGGAGGEGVIDADISTLQLEVQLLMKEANLSQARGVWGVLRLCEAKPP
jgi:hypothetical protein